MYMRCKYLCELDDSVVQSFCVIEVRARSMKQLHSCVVFQPLGGMLMCHQDGGSDQTIRFNKTAPDICGVVPVFGSVK